MEFRTFGAQRHGPCGETQRKLAVAGFSGDGGQVIECRRVAWLLLENPNVQLLGLLGFAGLLASQRQRKRTLYPRGPRGREDLSPAAGPGLASVPSHTYPSAEHPTRL